MYLKYFFATEKTEWYNQIELFLKILEKNFVHPPEIFQKSADVQYKYKVVTAQVQHVKGGIMYEFRELNRR